MKKYDPYDYESIYVEEGNEELQKGKNELIELRDSEDYEGIREEFGNCVGLLMKNKLAFEYNHFSKQHQIKFHCGTPFADATSYVKFSANGKVEFDTDYNDHYYSFYVF